MRRSLTWLPRCIQEFYHKFNIGLVEVSQQKQESYNYSEQTKKIFFWEKSAFFFSSFCV